MTQTDTYPALTQNAIRVLEKRYFGQGRGDRTDHDEDEMFRRVARNLSEAELGYGATPEERQLVEDRFYSAMRSLELVPNSPTLMNAGRELQQLSACFVLPVPDSLEGIFEQVKQTALIHKSGGGTGFSFSDIRPKGDIVGSTGGVASGPVSFIRAFDVATDVIKQGGTRRGANIAILDVSHPDIMEFIHSKRTDGDISNFNISVAVTHEFMQKVEAGGQQELINPRTNKKTDELPARELFDAIAESAWRTGDPGLVFIDRINEQNPNPQLGPIRSTNPCAEQPLGSYESCNLASINLARMLDPDGQIDSEKIAETVRLAVRMLDNVIDMNRYPIPEIAEMTRSTRRIGLGVMGTADMLIEMGLPYDSPEGRASVEQVLEEIHNSAWKASEDLALERGAYPEWERSPKLEVGGHGANGLRNTAPTTIAPTGTISIIAGCSSGIEPLYALAYERNVMDGTILHEANPAFERVARAQGFWSDRLAAELARTGSCQHIPEIPEDVRQVFKTSHDIAPADHVAMQAAAQRHVDNAVSKTVNLSESATVDDVRRMYEEAYRQGCKGITVYRDGSKAGQVLSTSPNGASANGLTPTSSGTHDAARPRPRVVDGTTERVRTGHGNLYVTVTANEDGEPFEIFSNLGKAGGCDSAQIEAISRLASMSLRAGIDPAEIVQQLSGITCCPAWDEGVQIRSTPDGIAVALARATGGQKGVQEAKRSNKTPLCPDCRLSTEFSEGCIICRNCGWNACE